MIHFALLVSAFAPDDADASALLSMSSGAADMALSGTTIAEPLAPSGALFHNPAGLCSFEQTTVSSSLGLGFGSTKINNDAGYDEKEQLYAVFPDGAVSFAPTERFRWGFGMYGSVGMNYDFDADPDAGVDNDFHAELSIGEMPFAVAYRVSDSLYLGAEVIGLFGHLRNRYTVNDQTFKYTLRGPGVQGMVGATWLPHERLSFGLGIRTPGRIWLDGSTAVPAGVRRDVDLEIEMPTQISLGVTHQLVEAVSVSISGRWTDSSSFSDSDIEFDGLSAANIPLIPDARDEWRMAIGVEIEAAPAWRIRLGANRSNAIVGTKGISPLVFDNDDVRVSAGLSYRTGDWNFDGMFGYAFHEGRDVGEEKALVVPGHYDSGGGIVMLGFTRRL